MKNQKIIVVCMLMLVSLTLVWCWSSWDKANTTNTDQQVVKVNTGIENKPAKPQFDNTKKPPRPQSPEELEANKKLIAAREEEITSPEIVKDDSWSSQRITGSEILYAAKVWDSIEAHPAWLTVTVTLDNDTITWLEIDQESSSPKSARHQAQFAEQITSKVVGKKLSESDTIYLSVASSTSQAFNDSIEEIQELYTQSQG